MKFLTDTHMILWASVEPERLPAAAHQILTDPANDLFFSSVNFWEIAIKRALNRPGFQPDPRKLRTGLLDIGFLEIPLTAEHTFGTLTLPPIHKDLFDRILIAQAISEGLTLLTSDAQIAKYPGPIRKV